MSIGLRTDIVEFILDNSIAISLFGFGFMIIGGTMILNLFLNARRRYYHSKVERNFITVDSAVIQHYLQSYWERVFPNQVVPMRLSIKKNKIGITADLPYTPKEEQEEFMLRIKKDLREIFTKIIGYPDDFNLSLSFQSKPKSLNQ
jgi:hypothetical protein